MSSDSSLATDSLPVDHELVLKVIPMPADCNPNGDIFGGWVMAQIDLASSVLPTRLSKGRVTTVAANEIIFRHPVRVGDLLSFLAKIERIGRTSMTVNVEVYAQGIRTEGRHLKVAQATLTYVAIDDAGRPREIARHTL